MKDGKLALLYLIIVATITLSYIDEENFGLMKQAIAALTSTHTQSEAE